MKDSNKKIVAFDTSFLIEVKRNNIDIEKEYPVDSYVRIVQDTVIDEFFLNKQNQWCNRSDTANFFKQNDISLLESFKNIILQEYICGKNNVSITKTFNITEFLRGQHPEQPQKESMYFNYVGQRNQSKQNDFDAIPYTQSSAVSLNVPKIQKDIVNDINSENGYHLLVVPEPNPTVIEVRNGKMWINFKYAINRCRHKLPKFFQNLEEEFPTIYNLLVYDQFTKSLERPENTRNHRNNAFYITLKTKTEVIQNVKIEVNTLPDFRISLAGLVYLDTFATCDKYQALLIKGLYPSYFKKIDFYQNNIIKIL